MGTASFKVAPSLKTPAEDDSVTLSATTLEDDSPAESVKFIGSHEGRHELIAIAVVEGAIERYRASLPWRKRRDAAGVERKVRELRRLVMNAHREIAQLAMTDPAKVAPVALDCVDELQEGCRGAFIPLSRGEAKMVVLSIVNDMGISLSVEDIKTISTHDADQDLILFVRDDKIRRHAGSAAWGVACAVVAFAVLVISPYVFDYPSFLPQFEIQQMSPLSDGDNSGE